jgi:hypothetical protein
MSLKSTQTSVSSESPTPHAVAGPTATSPTLSTETTIYTTSKASQKHPTHIIKEVFKNGEVSPHSRLAFGN